MSFGLKNARTTYQNAMMTLFHDIIQKEIEVYVDDMIAKSKESCLGFKKVVQQIKKVQTEAQLYKMFIWI
jgi:hypothetical protein